MRQRQHVMTVKIGILALLFSIPSISLNAQGDDPSSEAGIGLVLRKLDASLFGSPFPPVFAMAGTFDVDFLTLAQDLPSIGIRFGFEQRFRTILSGEGGGTPLKDVYFTVLLRATHQGSSSGLDLYAGYVTPDMIRTVQGGPFFKSGFDIRVFAFKPHASIFFRMAFLFHENLDSQLRSLPEIGLGVSLGYQRPK